VVVVCDGGGFSQGSELSLVKVKIAEDDTTNYWMTELKKNNWQKYHPRDNPNRWRKVFFC
jgi:hypothetical protein